MKPCCFYGAVAKTNLYPSQYQTSISWNPKRKASSKGGSAAYFEKKIMFEIYAGFPKDPGDLCSTYPSRLDASTLQFQTLWLSNLNEIWQLV